MSKPDEAVERRLNVLAAPIAKPTSVHRIPSLDGIRAVSFMVVFAAHAGLGPYGFPGDFGVTIFFFLSGYLITTLMRAEYEKNGAVNLRHFWLRRALRILPPFYLVVLVATLAALALYPPGTVSAASIPAELLFYANYWGIYGGIHEAPGTGIVWSLAVEEHFYVLFPLLYVAMQRCRMTRLRQVWLLWGMCALVLAWRCVLVMAMHADSSRIYLATDTRVDSILFGCSLALWNNPALDKPLLSPNIWQYFLLPAALIALVLCLASGGPVFRETWSFTGQELALMVIFVAAVRFHTWPLFRVLNSRPVVFVGVCSYSLYLVHDVLLQAISRLWPQSHAWQRAVIGLAASILTSWVIYEVIERPCATLRKRLTD